MKKLLFLFPSVLFAGGCAATLTPSGDIYTELLVPTSTVIVEERPAPVVVSAPPPAIVPAPRPVVVSAPRPKPARPRFNPDPRSRANGLRYAKNLGPRPTSGASRPGTSSRPPNGHHSR